MTTTPTTGQVTSWYGKRKRPLKPNGTYGTAFHAGVDIGSRGDRAIVAPQSGVVTRVTSTAARGLYVDVRLDGDDGRYTARAQHLASTSVVVGQRVTEGQQIGVMGTSGGVALHLHLEILDRGTAIDPVPWYRARGVSLGYPNVVVLGHQTTATPDTLEDEMFDADKMLRMAYTEDLGRPAADAEIYPRLRRILEAPDPRVALAQEINGIDASSESNRHEVHKIYQRRLGRHGTVAEWDGWIASVGGRDGIDLNATELAKIDAGILASPEGKAYAARVAQGK